MLNQLCNVNFKSENQPYSVNYNKRQTPPMPDVQIPMEDIFMLQAMEQQKADKKEQNKEKWNKAGIGAQIALAGAFCTMAIVAVMGLIKANKFSSAEEAAKRAEEEIKALTKVELKWTEMSNAEKKVAQLDSKTTSKSLKEAFENILAKNKLSDKARDWSGTADGAMDIIYLYGHGGTGKTYVSKQFAQEIGAKYTCVKFPDIATPYKDTGSVKVNNLFENIIKEAEKEPDKRLVVCIDEIDAVMRKVTEGHGGAEEAAKTRGAVLTGLDMLREKCKNVTVIATSNYHPENGVVDPIALRRFNNKIEVKLPDKEQVPALLEMYLKNIGATKDKDFFNSSEFKSFARKLQNEGYSNGEIELISKESAKIFSKTLEKVSDSDLSKYPFKIKYLEEALKVNGKAASKTNDLMKVKGKNSNSQPRSLSDFSFFDKIRLLFRNWKQE